MNAATNRDTGVTTTTTSAMRQLSENMKPSVPKMVITPVKSWVNPINRPSENWSASAMTRLTSSPWECASR